MPGHTDFAGGVRNGGSEDLPQWHTLESLKQFRKPAQVELAESLSSAQKGITETSAAFESRVKARWSADTLTMLSKAEVHYRKKSRLPPLDFPTTGGAVARFKRWATSFFTRLRIPRVALRIKNAKAAEGAAAPKPKADGLNLQGTTSADKKRRQALAIAALSVVIRAPPSKFRALTALKRCGSDEALADALSDDPERRYLVMLTDAATQTSEGQEDSDSEADTEPECGRVGCSEESESKYSISKTGEAKEDLPLCAECHAQCVLGLAAKNKRKAPGHARWPHMAAHWVLNNPKAGDAGCWSCDKKAETDNSGLDLSWCDGCLARSVTELVHVSEFECATWTDDGAKDYLDAVKEKLKKKKKKKKGEAEDLTGSASDDDEKGEGDSDDSVSGDECVLCGVACGDDRVGRISTVPVPKGQPAFHRRCRSKAVHWWRNDPSCVASVKALNLNAAQQFEFVVKRARAVRDGTATLSIPDAVDKYELADTLEGMGSLETPGGAKAKGLLAFADMIRGNESGAKASPEDRREFGLDNFPWDIRDAAVESAKRRGGRFVKRNVADREMEREEFLWWLVEGTSMDAASTESGRELVQLGKQSGALC